MRLVLRRRCLRGAAVAVVMTVVWMASSPSTALSPPEDYPQVWSESSTMTEKHGTMVRLYWAVFDRVPDLGGVRFWREKMDTCEWGLARIAAFFEQSPEFQRTYGVLVSDAEFVTLVYSNVFGRPPDDGGRSFWVGELRRGVSRGDVILRISASDEFASARPLQSDGIADLPCGFSSPLHGPTDLHNCGDFGTQAEAQAHHDALLAAHGRDVDRLDGDNDGEACESLP